MLAFLLTPILISFDFFYLPRDNLSTNIWWCEVGWKEPHAPYTRKKSNDIKIRVSKSKMKGNKFILINKCKERTLKNGYFKVVACLQY